MNKTNDNQIPYEKMPECFAAALSYFLKFRPVPSMTQTKLAETIGVTQGYITKLASGKVGGAEEIRRKISAVYGYDGSDKDRTYDEFLKIGYAVLNQPDTHQKDNNTKEDLNIKLRKAHLNILLKDSKGLLELYQDKVTAHGINRLLIDIEKIDPQRLIEIHEYIKMVHQLCQDKKTIDTKTGNVL